MNAKKECRRPDEKSAILIDFAGKNEFAGARLENCHGFPVRYATCIGKRVGRRSREADNNA
jgi:hypothetical protein